MTAIQQKTEELFQNEGISLGAPQTEETPCRSEGVMQIFEKGMIVYHPSLGTFFMKKEIRKKYEESGGVNKSPLGFPIADEQYNDKNQGKSCEFEMGKILWNASDGAVIKLNPEVRKDSSSIHFHQTSQHETSHFDWNTDFPFGDPASFFKKDEDQKENNFSEDDPTTENNHGKHEK